MGSSNWNESPSFFPQSHVWERIFHLFFIFPAWNVGGQDHTAFPSYSQDASELSFLNFFVPIHAELLEWLPAHTVLFHISETLSVGSPPPQTALPTPISPEKLLPFICPLGHHRGLFPQDAHSFLALCMMKFTGEVVWVCLHAENIRY